jgi:hypothetical protein
MRTAVLRHHADPTDFVKDPPGNDEAAPVLSGIAVIPDEYRFEKGA